MQMLVSRFDEHLDECGCADGWSQFAMPCLAG